MKFYFLLGCICIHEIKVEPSGYISNRLAQNAFSGRIKRDVHVYARPGPGTKYVHGYGQRFAPYEWPKWYVWHIEQFDSPNRIVAAPSGGNSMGHGWQK